MAYLDVTKMNDVELARTLRNAYQRISDDTDATDVYADEVMLATENEICGRLEIELGMTEQGLTPEAQEMLDAYIKEYA